MLERKVLEIARYKEDFYDSEQSIFVLTQGGLE